MRNRQPFADAGGALLLALPHDGLEFGRVAHAIRGPGRFPDDLHVGVVDRSGAPTLFVGNFSKGILHGGVISSTLDVVGGMAAMMAETSDHAQAIVQRWAALGTIDMRLK